MSNENRLERNFGLEPDFEDVLERRSKPKEQRRAGFSVQDYVPPTEQEKAEFAARLAAMTEEERNAWEKEQEEWEQL